MIEDKAKKYINNEMTILDKGLSEMGRTIAEDVVSMGYAINSGMNLGSGRFATNSFNPRALSSMGKLGVLGAGVGAASTMFSEGTINPIGAAGVGAAVGAFGLPAFGVASGFIGNAVINGVTSNTAAGIPGAIAKGVGAASPVAFGALATFGARTANRLYGVGSKLINWNEGAENFSQIKFTNPISGFASARKARLNALSSSSDSAFKRFKNQSSALKEGIKGSINKIDKAKMGSNMGMVNMTPSYSSYSQNAGATGDLVFALNKNRRG